MNQWRKGIASWKVGKTLYQSIPFTWLLPDAEKQAKEHKGPVISGGPAVKLMGAPWSETPEYVPFDVLSFHNPLATFTTRGCPNRCTFCAVPKIEGDLVELNSWKPGPVICDNNLLASSSIHFTRVIDSLRPYQYVDFNQGLEAKRLKPFHVDLLRSLKSAMIRFAFDHFRSETSVHDAIELCRSHGLKNLSIYCLIGFSDNPGDASARLELCRSWGIRPFAMRYNPLDAIEKNTYVGDGWKEADLRKFTQYYNHLRWYEHIPFDEFERFPYREPTQTSLF